jgi:2-polyprenyl-3-methyl-5-hydroxy-6-metoxy-1,4-benzoquinol methylase
MTSYQCKVCDNTENSQVVVVREMMFGMRDEFRYFKCSSCGCLQIIEPPKDIVKYYPDELYHAHQPIESRKFKNFVKRILFNAYWHLNLPVQAIPFVKKFQWLKIVKITKKSAILDVGCGNGCLLKQMSNWGFKNLTGIDPYVEKDITYPLGANIWKTDVYNYLACSGSSHCADIRCDEFELIMLHHSFEHMDNPRAVLNQLHKILALEGKLLIRIPVSDSFAWRKYGVNWYQLDAPRHFFLHTTKSMALLAKNCGFVLKQVIYDSTEKQFLNSEKYCRDITLYEGVKISSFYVRKCKRQAACLNKMKDGDQACFLLEKNK